MDEGADEGTAEDVDEDSEGANEDADDGDAVNETQAKIHKEVKDE